ncbi:class I SAM-dependent methyltransferase [Aliifodinibius salicampi]|uniref:Class I SAM-dependent methyltransferase n=1 Tax=Fodinibius salicampi TaxID=1920655 RepID=A0ABT3PVS5_9BACT|nr:class I SAM-dependent methyltransferase [Fodinibius salicampi]MCW9711948.1 class I SAM-dependent methyltransferase [Fodinibius salicampi]
MKSTVDEIRERFDNDVDRFSNLETGQSATIDAPLVLELITQAAAKVNPDASHILDIGCGAGNYALKLHQILEDFNVDLIDLSKPMLERATERIEEVSQGEVFAMQGDIRELSLEDERYDIIVSAATLHHLRDEKEWEQVFAKVYRALKPGGSFWISDLVKQSVDALQSLMWQRYGEYLTDFRDKEYRDQVFSYIEKEDTPRSVIYQIDLMRSVGFREVEILHKNTNFAAFGGIK